MGRDTGRKRDHVNGKHRGDIRVLGERARVLVASRGHRETVYERVKFAIPHRVACENFFAIFAIFAKKLFAAEFATFT